MLYHCAIAFFVQVVVNAGLEEPTCFSRFDYDYKMLN